jgi:hypothetical protein
VRTIICCFFGLRGKQKKIFVADLTEAVVAIVAVVGMEAFATPTIPADIMQATTNALVKLTILRIMVLPPKPLSPQKLTRGDRGGYP